MSPTRPPRPVFECVVCGETLQREAPDGMCGFCAEELGAVEAPEPGMGGPPAPAAPAGPRE